MTCSRIAPLAAGRADLRDRIAYGARRRSAGAPRTWVTQKCYESSPRSAFNSEWCRLRYPHQVAVCEFVISLEGLSSSPAKGDRTSSSATGISGRAGRTSRLRSRRSRKVRSRSQRKPSIRSL